MLGGLMFIKKKIKQLFCNHDYRYEIMKQKPGFYSEEFKKIVQPVELGFVCTKCGKRRRVFYDKKEIRKKIEKKKS